MLTATFAATDGVAVYKWVASDLDTVAFYELEHKTVKAGLASISPSRGYITIIVSDAI